MATKKTTTSKESKDLHIGFWEKIRNYWRPLAAVVYLSICIFDFIVAPYLTQMHMATDLSHIFEYVLQMPIDQQTQALEILHSKSQWQSLTLMGGGLFHIAFGAILGVASWTRGLEKKEAVKANTVMPRGR